jgi:ATP-dependent DNA helicase RecQ
VAAVLGARRTKWSTAQPWVEELPFHGALKSWSDDRLRQLLTELVRAGLARQSSGEYPVVELTPAGRDAMTRGTPPPLTLPPETATRGTRAVTHPAAPIELVDRLRQWRLETARASGVPAFVVFHDSTLNAIAAAQPTTLIELLHVSGVGDSKLRKYGEEVLEVLRTPSV